MKVLIVHINIYIGEHSEVPSNIILCKTHNTFSEHNILHLSLELNFVDIKILKFPMCYTPWKAWDSSV